MSPINTPPSAPSGGWVEGIARNVTWMTGETAVWVTKTVASLPIGVAKGIHDVWTDNKDDMLALIATTADFMKSVPFVGGMLDRMFQKNPVDIESLKNLTNQELWIQTFRENPGILTNGVPIEIPAGETGITPFDFLQSLPQKDRQAIYMNYVDAFIPPAIQESEGVGLNKNNRRTVQERFNATSGHRADINRALGGILGLDAWNENGDPATKDRAFSLATKSLSSYYQMNDPNFPREVTDKLVKDYQRTVQNSRFANFGPATTDAFALAQNLPASRIKGALQLQDLLSTSQLQALSLGTEQIDLEKNLAKSASAGKYAELTGAIKESQKKGAESLSGTWNKLGTVEKFVLLGAVIFALRQSKFVRTAALGLTGAYFAQKFLLKQKDPFALWGGLLQSGVDKVKGTNRTIFGEGASPKEGIDEVASTTNTMVEFLSEYDRANMTQEAVAMSLVHNMPMRILANSFKMGGTNGERWSLDISRGSALDIEISLDMKKRGLKTGHREYFSDPENVAKLTDAVGFVFYKRAKESGLSDNKVKEVEEAWGKLPPGSSLAYLPSPYTRNDKQYNFRKADPKFDNELLNAQELYVQLVAQGCQQSLGDNQQMGEFVARSMGVAVAPRDKVVVHNHNPAPGRLPPGGTLPPPGGLPPPAVTI